MIIEKVCLFLFNDDLKKEYRNNSVNNIRFEYLSNDNNKIGNLLKNTRIRMAVYIDPRERVIVNFIGPRKDKIEHY